MLTDAAAHPTPGQGSTHSQVALATTAIPGTAWTLFQGTATVPAGDTLMRAMFTLGAPSASLSAQIDQCQAVPVAKSDVDTGWLYGASTGWWSSNSNWTELTTHRARKIGNRVRVEIAVQRLNSALNANATTGAMAVAVGNIDAAWCPIGPPTPSLRLMGAVIGPVVFSLAPGGALATVSYTPGQSIAVGTNVLLQADWICD
jgi:hypothetical protein